MSCVAVCRTVIRVQLAIWPEFTWRDAAHGGSLRWHIWVEDSDGQALYHSEVQSMFCWNKDEVAT